MLGGRTRPARVYGLLIRCIWIMGGIGLNWYCRNLLGCRLNRSCGGGCGRECARRLGRSGCYSGRGCSLRCRRSGLNWCWFNRRGFFLCRPRPSDRTWGGSWNFGLGCLCCGGCTGILWQARDPEHYGPSLYRGRYRSIRRGGRSGPGTGKPQRNLGGPSRS